MSLALAPQIAKALLSKGYFPQELPPVFTTRDFGKHHTDILKEWQNSGLFGIKVKFPKVDGKFYRGRYTYKNVLDAEPETLSKPKRLYERRNIHITHHIPQALLATEIAKGWRDIQKWLTRQEYSLDKITIRHEYKRALKEINFQMHAVKISYIESTSDWLVKTDITRFYPSIYTQFHSLGRLW